MRQILFILFFAIPFLHAFAQLDIGEITNKYNTYNESFPQVRVHLELNQPKYTPGDTAYFKAYFLSYDFQPIKGEQFITVQLSNNQGERVHIQNVKVINGKADNQLIFPNTLPAGQYTIEAYSDWMKNFEKEYYFRKQVDLAGRNKVARQSVSDSAPQLYAEGGQLIAEVNNHVVITSALKGTGSIVSSSSGATQPFEIGDDGFAKLTFRPTANETYFVKLNRSEARSEAIVPKADGLALEIVSLGECSPIQLQISVPERSALRSQQLYLITTSYGKVTYSKVFSLSELEMTTALVPYRSLRDGLNQIYIMTTSGEILVERVYFLSPMYSQVEIKINERDLLYPRDSVEVQVLLSDFFGNPIKGEFSLSVNNQKLFDQDLKVPSLRNSLFLFSDLPALQERFQSSGTDEEYWMKSINEWLITQSWKRNDWSTILKSEKPDGLIPFRKSLSLKGRILSRETNMPLGDSATISFYQDKKKIVYSTQVSTTGEFHLPLINDYANEDRFYYKVEAVNPKAKLEDYYLVSEMVNDSVRAPAMAQSDLVDPYGEYMQNKRIIDHSFGIYRKRTINPGPVAAQDPNADYLSALGGPDVDILMSDYVVFATVEELIHEVVGGLQVRRSGGASAIRVPIFSGGYTRIPSSDPLYIINGIMTLDTRKFLELKPDQLVYLKVVNDQGKLSRFGAFGTHGVVVVLTQQKGINEQSLNSKFFRLPGVNEAVMFPVVKDEGPDAQRIPQLRAAIHWNPSVSNSFKGLSTTKIRLTDDLGPMQVSVSGVTFDGNPFSGTIRFIVNRPGYVVIN